MSQKLLKLVNLYISVRDRVLFTFTVGEFNSLHFQLWHCVVNSDRVEYQNSECSEMGAAIVNVNNTILIHTLKIA